MIIVTIHYFQNYWITSSRKKSKWKNSIQIFINKKSYNGELYTENRIRLLLSPPFPNTLSQIVHRRCFCCGSSVLPTKFVQWRPFIDLDLLYKAGLSSSCFCIKKKCLLHFFYIRCCSIF